MSSLAQLIQLSEVCVSALPYLQRTAFQLLSQDDLQLFAAQYFAKVHLKIHSINGELPEDFLFLYRIILWQNASPEGCSIKQSYVIQWQSLWGHLRKLITGAQNILFICTSENT